jgi:hypothetical protein
MAVIDEFTTTLNKRAAVIRAERGTVSKAESDTVVTTETTGGGGYISGGSGHISAPTTTSKITKSQRVYVTDEEGRDTILDFNDHVLAVREGHPLTMIRAFIEGVDGPLSLAYVNHSTGQLAMRVENIRGCWGLGNLGAILFLAAMAALAVVGWGVAELVHDEMGLFDGATLWLARFAAAATGVAIPIVLFARWRNANAAAFISSQRFQDMLEKVKAQPAR